MSGKFSLQELFDKAKLLHQQKKLREAESYYNKVLKLQPGFPEAHHLLGILCSQSGNHQNGINHILKAIEKQPANPIYYHNLGKVYAAARHWDAAIQSYKIATKLSPKFAEAFFNLAIALKAKGQLEKAVQAYLGALKVNPGYAEAWYNLGIIYQETGRMKSAREAYEECLDIQPDYALAHNNLASVLEHWDESEKALLHYHKALDLLPGFTEAMKNLAGAYEKQGYTGKARKYYNLMLYQKGKDALEGWAEWHLVQLSEIIWPDTESIIAYRNSLFKSIDAFYKKPPQLVLSKLAELSIQPPYDLAYQGKNDYEIKKRYGQFFEQYFKQLRPQIHQGSPHTIRATHRHVGFVVTSGHEGVFIKCMRGIINHLDTNTLQVTIVCNAPNGEEILRPSISNPGVQFLSISQKVDMAIRQVQNAKFDILYYWEIGTDTLNYFLPFCQLAPVQCTSWGWPVTSGIPSVQYFISCHLLENKHSKGHYTESLIQFKKLPTYYYRPPVPETQSPIDHFDLPQDKAIYLCAQNLRKVHPEMDELFARILQKDPEGIVVFIQDKKKNITQKLKDRLAKSCPKVYQRIYFLRRMNEPDYLNLLKHATVILDTLYYTGGANTAYDAFATGTPYITLPSEYHRGNYGAAAYRQLGAVDLIVDSKESYIDKAVKVANDPAFRRRLSQQILAGGPQIFEDLEAVKELESFFKTIS